jgi:hypothetical protein
MNRGSEKFCTEESMHAIPNGFEIDLSFFSKTNKPRNSYKYYVYHSDPVIFPASLTFPCRELLFPVLWSPSRFGPCCFFLPRHYN